MKNTHLFVLPPPSSWPMKVFGKLQTEPDLTTFRLAQRSIVKSLPLNAHRELFGTWTNPEVPSNSKACPTSPAVNEVPPCGVPLLIPAISFTFPSPGHHAT